MIQCYVCEISMYVRATEEYANARFINFPKYYWALRGIGGSANDNWALSLLGESGTDFPTSNSGSSDVQAAPAAITGDLIGPSPW